MARHAGAVLGMLLFAHAAAAQFTQQGSKLVGVGAIGSALQGSSVAISADGNTAIVGGNQDNSGAGAAWVYTRGWQLWYQVWSQEGNKLVGYDTVGSAYQGTSVAISADGNTAIVGAYNDNSGTGAAWVYTRSGGAWRQQGGKLVGTGAIGSAYQGYSVAISGDGNTAIVGGVADNSYAGAAWVYTRSGGAWSQQGSKLVGSDAHGSGEQGFSVAISGDGNTAVVGAQSENAIRVYTRSNGVWSQQGGKLTGTGGAVGYSNQGYSVAISGDGNTIVVGGTWDNDAVGAAWVWARSGGVWSQQGSKLVGTGTVGSTYQGTSVAISGDGNTAVVGGTNDNSGVGAAWVYTRSGGVWSQQGSKLVGTGAVGAAKEGGSVAVSADATTIIVGGNNDSPAGAAWVFVAYPYPAPSITIQPQSQSIQIGQNATLSVTVTGAAPLYYQWYQGGSGDTSQPVGTNASSFTTPALTATTSYWVRVSNAGGHADSATATVSISSCALPSITLQPQSQSIPSGQNATLSVTATGAAPLYYQWYQGASGNTSQPVGANASSFTTPALTATTSYWVRIFNVCGYADSATAIISICLSITVQPQNQSIEIGQTATLSVTATGAAPLYYQWYQGLSGDTSQPVGTNASSFTTPALTATTSYWVRVTNSCGQTDSATAIVSVGCTLPAITGQPQSQSIQSGQAVILAVAATSKTPLSYQWYQGASGNTSQPVGASASSFTTPALTVTTSYWVRVFNVCGYADSATAIVWISSGTLTITPDKNPANQGETVTFTFSPIVNQPGDLLVFNFGDGGQLTVSYSQSCQFFGGCKVATHTYLSSGTFTVSASGVASGQSVNGTTSITIVNTCAQPSAPTANFTWTPAQPRVGQVVTFTDTSTNVPAQWQWSFGDGSPITGPGGSSALQNPTYTYLTAVTQPTIYTVTLTATNCRGPATVSLPLTVLPACDQPAVPTPDFTWSPQGALAQFPQQMQPYVGQTVTFTDNSTNNPTAWKWWDFNLPQPWTPVMTQTTTFTWTTPGDKVVRHQAFNCAGGSPESFLKLVTVYPDVRSVSADFIWAPDPITTGTTITFTAAQGFAYGDPTVFTWTFDDSATPFNGSSVTHNFACAGQHKVTLTAQRGSYADTEAKTVPVTGTQCGPDSVQTVDAAKTPGLNGTNWKSDLRIFNPSSQPTSVWIAALPVIADNSQPSVVGPWVLNPHAALVLNDILGTIAQVGGAQYTNAAIRVTYQNPNGIGPIVTNRTYTPSPNGGTFGQYAPGVPVYVGMTPPTLWITGLRNNGLDQGYRTNYSIANLRGDPGVLFVAATLYDATGAVAAKQFFPALQPFGYLHDSVANLFGGTTQTIGTFSLKIDVPQGADIEVFASVVDNLTGDPYLIPGTPTPNSPIFIPAVAHTTGLAGSVWRSDLQLTNPDLSSPHTYVVEYRPKASDHLPNASKSVSVAPGSSLLMSELVGWIYGALLPAGTNTSGVVHVTPQAPSTSYPIVASRSYNQTGNGTFGQNLLPQVAAMGVQTYTDGRKLLLTGMSSYDIARTNVGFVNLSETQGVYFVVYFYDEGGNVLNPLGTDGKPMPYELSLDVGGWNQQLLEDMFLKSSWGMTLPSNLRVISAIAQVISGGPGMIYATVIDNQTNDGNFIPTQASQAGMQ